MKIYLTNIKKVNSISSDVISHFPEREKKSSRFAFDDDKKRSMCAGALLWKILGLEDKDIYFIENEKPASDKVREKFNISHSGDYVVLAVSQWDVGVDIEKANDKSLTVSKRVYTENEITWMNENPLPRFNTLWTMKESIMKVTGLGLQLTPSSFDVMPLLDNKSIEVNGVSYYGKTTNIDDYALSVASPKEIDKIEIIEINEF